MRYIYIALSSLAYIAIILPFFRDTCTPIDFVMTFGPLLWIIAP